MSMNRIQSTVLAAALLVTVTSAQDLVPKAAPQAKPILLRGATLHTVSGDVIEGGDLYFAEGEIRAVAKRAEGVAQDALVIDLTGKHVYPGFVLATSTLGLVEVESVDMTIDQREGGTHNPEIFAAVAVNPDSWWLPVARRNGVLVAGVFPQGGVIPGRISTIQLDGWTWEDMTLDRDGGLSIAWPMSGGGRRFGRGRAGADGADAQDRIDRIDQLFEAAEAYHAARAADAATPSDLRFEAMAKVIAGEVPVFIDAMTREQAEQAILWATGRGLVPRLIGGRDVLQFTDLLKRHGVMVAIPGTHRLPHRRDLSYRTTYELPRKLEEAGVKWCLTMRAGDSANARNLVYEAAATIAHGLDEEAALRAITLAPAEFLGVGDRVGSLEAGKHATLFVADGSPFDLTTKIERAWIGGREIVLEDKQTALFEKYREKYRQMGLLGD